MLAVDEPCWRKVINAVTLPSVYIAKPENHLEYSKVLHQKMIPQTSRSFQVYIAVYNGRFRVAPIDSPEISGEECL